MIDLSAGEPVFPTPEYAARAAIDAIGAGRMGYPPTAGTTALREAIARYLAESSAHSRFEASDVIVSAGAKQALFNCIFCLFERGDEVLVPAPLWPSYTTIIELAGASPVIVPTHADQGFALDLEAVEAARTPRTRGIVINSPSNPSGATYDRATIEHLVRWTGEHDLWLLSDEIYRRLYFEGSSAPSVLDVPDRPPRVVVVDGVSKAFAMTGWRIGFAVGPRELIAKATDLQSQTTSGAAGPSQAAAAAALGDSEQRERHIAQFVATLRKNRDVGVALLRDTHGIVLDPPPGGIYLFAGLAGGAGSLGVAERLLNEAEVACIPGDTFHAPGFLRFNFAVPQDLLSTGLERVRACLSS